MSRRGLGDVVGWVDVGVGGWECYVVEETERGGEEEERESDEEDGEEVERPRRRRRRGIRRPTILVGPAEKEAVEVDEWGGPAGSGGGTSCRLK